MRQNHRALARTFERTNEYAAETHSRHFSAEARHRQSVDRDRYAGSKPLLQALLEKGGLATTKSNVLRLIVTHLLKIGAGERIIVPDIGGGLVMQDHIHACQSIGCVIHFLPIDGDAI